MAAVGILIALRERERSGQGQLVDCSMFDGSLSFLAMLAGEMLAGGRTPRRGELRLAGGLVCYRPYRCADGYVTLGGARAQVLGRRSAGAWGARICSSTRSIRPGPRRTGRS